MAITEPYGIDAVTVGTTELSVVSGTTTLQTVTTDGIIQVQIDTANMAKGDEFKVRLYEKCRSGSTKRITSTWSMMGVQAENFVTPTFINMHGWDVTIQKLAGTDRAFDASIRQVS